MNVLFLEILLEKTVNHKELIQRLLNEANEILAIIVASIRQQEIINRKSKIVNRKLKDVKEKNHSLFGYKRRKNGKRH